jgi:restriction endonuclease S subunit
MTKILLGKVLVEQKKTVGTKDGNNLPLMGVNNKEGIHLSRQSRLNDVSRYKLLEKGWFAYNPMRINVGSIGYVDSNSKTGIISPDYVVFSCSNLINPDYFFHFIKSDLGLLEISKNTGGSVRERLYFQNLSKIEINLPHINEQNKIAKALNRKKNSIRFLDEEFDVMSEDFRLLISSILQEAIQGKLTKQDPKDEPAEKLLHRIKAEKQKLIAAGKLKKEKELPPISKDEIPFGLPKGWVWCRLENVSNNIHYGFNASANESVSEIRLLRITDIQENNVNWVDVPGCVISEKEYQSYSLNDNDILIARTGGTIGKSYLVRNLSLKAVFASYLIRVIPSALINSEYLKLFIESPLYWRQLLALSSGTGQPNVNGTSLKSLITPLPPFSEQKRIVVKVEQLMQMVNKLEQQVQQSKEQASQLLQVVLRDAFTNKKEYEENEEITMAAEE